MENLARKISSTLLDDTDRVDYPTVRLVGSQVDALGLWAHDVGASTKMQATIRISSKSKDSGEERYVTVELVEAVVKKPEGADANKMFPTTVAA